MQGPHVGMEIVGADSLHGCRNKVVRVTENLCSLTTRFQRNQDQEKTGMKITNGIPLVMEQITKISSLNNLHASVTHLRFKEIYQDKIPLGGRLEAFRENWEMITKDQNLLESISGYKIEFSSEPIQRFQPKQIKLSEQEMQTLNSEIEEMLVKQAVEVVQTKTNCQFVSHLFVRPKKDGGMRPIFNLKTLNQFVVYNHFKMEGFQVVKNLIQRRDWLCKVDLKDAYFCIPICKNHRKYLRFQYKGQMLQYKGLPFGLASGPRLFTKIMKPVIALLRRIGVRLVIYLDDILLLNQSQEGLSRDRDTLLWLLHNLGWLINWKKSVLTPCQQLEFLGLTINSVEMEITLSATKVESIKRICTDMISKTEVSIQELSSLIGTLNATVEAVIPASLYVRELQMFQTKCLLKSKRNYQQMIILPQTSRGEINWWLQQLEHWNGKQIRLSSNPDLVIETDASKTGWGGSMSHSELKNGGALEPLIEKIAYQCTGTESSTVCNSITDQTQTEHSCSHQIRQHNSCCISEQNGGGDQIRTVITNNKADLDSLSIQKYHDYCRTYTRNTECSSRLGESSDEGYQQLDAEQGNIQTNKSDVGAIKNRSLCRQVEHTTGKLHELASRPICNGNGCIPDTLEQQKRVCFPSILPNNKMFVQSSERKVRNCHNNCSMADSTILSTTSDLVIRQPNSFTSHEKPATVTRGSSASTSQQSNLKASGLEGFRRQKQAAGVSEQTSELLAAGWRQGTRTAYNSCWRQWDSWCQSKQTDPFQTSVEYVADFLAELYAKGYEYRTINSYRSAISAFHAGIEGNKIGKHDLICQLMTGIFNKNPPRPRYMQMWDVNKVLSYIIGMENNKDLSLKEISMKLCMLMALASASRSSEIHKFDIENMNITEDEIIFTLKSLTKSRRMGQSPISVKFTKYEEHPKLDIISCTMEYLEKIKIIRAEEKQLFVSFIKPHKAVKSCTIASWLKNLLALSGIDVSVFKPHSTRGTSTSKANKYGLSIEQIINKGNF